MEIETITARPVRVSIPASVAGEIGSLKKSIGNVLDKLGCPACCSGHNLYLELQRDHVFSRDLKSSVLSKNPIKANLNKKVTSVRIGLKPKLATEIKNVHAAIDRIAEITGHVACATGCDMFFNLEEQFSIDEHLNIDERFMTIG